MTYQSTCQKVIDGWSSKKGVKTQQELMECAWVFATIRGKTKEGLEIWMQAKILEGVAAATSGRK